MNDLQIGTAGALIPGMYLRSAAQSAEWACNDIDGHPVSFTIIKGDITGNGKKEQLITAKHILDRLWCPYYVIPSYLDVVPVTIARDDSLYKEVFGLNETYYSFDREVNGVKFRFICLDSSYNPLSFNLAIFSECGHVPKEEMDWLKERLDESAREEKTVFIFIRDPLQPNIGEGMISGLPLADSSQLVELLGKYKNVWGVFCGSYFHRNHVYQSSFLAFPWVQTASVVDYPRGYNIYKVYTEGYIQAFYKINDLRATELSRTQTFIGFGDPFVYGSLSDRNFVWKAK
jgi:hypothetical protein